MINRNINILNNFNILYLEDDVELLKQTKDVLDDFMLEVFGASSIEESMKVLESEHIDIILSDILLKGENGVDFLKSLKESPYTDIPTVLITAHTETSYLLEAIKLKVANYIVKPINLKELLNTIHDIVLPINQHKEAQKSNNLIKTISEVTDGKQVEVIKYIMSNLNDSDEVNTSYSEIMSHIDISKPTLVKLFKKLSEKNILTNVSHKKYRFHQDSLDSL
ncbi:MAG: response regulator [Sulfurimonas sp.]|nr:MAG: response regulator [Sulfurimonas sp.]